MELKHVPEPWRSFLSDLDRDVDEDAELHCLGGFVMTMTYGAPRTTADIDALSIAPLDARDDLLRCGGEGSGLHRRHGVYLDYVGIATVPESYDERLTEMFPSAFEHLQLFALDPYDVALTKIERNIGRDREDVRHLARAAGFDVDKLRNRYEQELRPYLGNPEREDLTLWLWVEMIEEDRGQV